MSKSKREVIAYAISHAGARPRASRSRAGRTPGGCDMWTLAEARRFERDEAYEKCGPGARVIRIVRARPSEASATLETARRRLAAVAEHDRARQELASALEVDACRVGPSEASAVEVLRELVAWTGHAYRPLGLILDKAHRVLAASGPDPMPVVRAALETAGGGVPRRAALWPEGRGCCAGRGGESTSRGSGRVPKGRWK